MLMTLVYSRHIVEQSSNSKFHENPSCGKRVVQGGWTDGQNNTTKFLIAVRYVAKASNKEQPTTVSSVELDEFTQQTLKPNFITPV
jgi:hypothetical protein